MNKQFLSLLFLLPMLTVACASKSSAPAGAAASSKEAKASSTTTTKSSSKTTTASNAKAASVESMTKDGITVTKSVACRSVENRSPVGEAETFPSDVGRVYLFTQLKTTNPGNTSIQHVWHHNGKKMAEVTLPVNGSPWRTYSSKMIDASLKGDWKVDVTTSKGDLLQTVAFTVQ